MTVVVVVAVAAATVVLVVVGGCGAVERKKKVYCARYIPIHVYKHSIFRPVEWATKTSR